MVYPDRPTGNAWQLLGQGLTQGAGIVDNLGQQQNALRDLVDRRTAAALEQKRLEREAAQREWEFNQKLEDEKKKDASRKEVNDMLTNGVSVPGVKSIIPPTFHDVPGPIAAADSIPTPMASYQDPYKQMATPEQTITAPDTTRPAGLQDIKNTLFKYEQLSPKEFTDLSPFEEARAKAAGTMAGYTANNHADFMAAATKYVADKLASDPTRPASTAEIDAAAAAADPAGNRSADKGYQAYIKSFDKAAAAQNSNTAIARAGISQQNANTNARNADSNASRAASDATRAAKATQAVPGSNLDEKQLKERNKWQQGMQKNYEGAVTSTRSGTNLQAASNAFDTVNKTLDAKDISAAEVTGVKDQIAKLLNPGFAISKVQFAHLNNGGLVDEVNNWVSGLKGNEMLTPHQKNQYRTLVTRLGEELAAAHENIKKDYWTQAHKLSQQNGWTGADSVSLTPKDFSFDQAAQDSAPSIPGLIVGSPASAAGGPKLGDTKLNSHGVKVVFGPGGWGLAQ